VVETGKAAGYAVTGRGEEATESVQDAAKASGEGIKAVVEKPVESIGEGLQSMDRSVKKITGREDIK